MPKFADPIDLMGNELQNAKIQNLASPPPNPVPGQSYFDTSLSQFGVWNGGGWVYLVSGGGDDKTYEQAFTTTATVAVTHNLGKYPSVTVMDSAGDWVIGDVEYTGLNTLTVTFTAPFSGKVICN